ncbi:MULTISPECIES: DUF2889 domain-containing protein [unclassified Mycobacterium]|uniref:DUF2889 domain-containing protein n=1 Tax=unclassified Mycobacterium TaxID=2642494 RepID=UPI00274211E7|nr:MULTISPECIES: DUF2889 domain-containing protein [unclassified Mycobacterium]MDP7702260.1 DUF2889 domain-containing protein [Mycobacterium sp. TY815]MDP7720743.1 DUF2889 domain-containing protein [Mycobacterium sp. TY814]
MPFVTDILGPRRPVADAAAPLVAGRRRRTSTIDTHPDDTGGSHVDLRARDADGIGTRAEVRLGARLVDQVIAEISVTPQVSGVDRLLGERVGRGFRSTVATLFPEEIARSSLFHLLLDDWVGAALVSGYGVQHAAIVTGTEQKMPPGVADRIAGICAGFAPQASLIQYTRRHDVIPTGRGPAAPALDGLHDVEPLRAHGMRRFRRLELWPVDGGAAAFDARFRDSHMDDELNETIVHEYTVAGTVDTSSRSITSVDAQVRVLPWQECPGAIGSAGRIEGMTLRELRDRVRGELVGTSTCTHLNDTLRAIADLDALLEPSPWDSGLRQPT